jgi:NitT/TauT family transport system substrate-binding protein
MRNLGPVGVGHLLVRLAAFVVLLAAGCAPAAAPASAPAAKPAAPAGGPSSAPAAAAPPTAPARLESVSLLLDWFPEGYHAPFYVARDRGYYREAGLDVEIHEGKGSGNAAQLVGTKTATFGFAEGGAVAKAIGQGIPVRVVAGIFRRSPLGFSYLKESGISSPKDLEGKTYGVVPGSATHSLWPAFVAANRIDESKITDVNIDPVGADAAMLTGRIHFTDALVSAEPIRYQEAGKEGGILLMGDYGVTVVGHGIIANNETIADKPALVRGFVDASLRAWDDTRKNPDEAIDVFRQSVPEKSREIARAALVGTLPLLESEGTRGRPLGFQSESDWDSTLQAIALAGLTSLPRADQVFTNEFIAAR